MLPIRRIRRFAFALSLLAAPAHSASFAEMFPDHAPAENAEAQQVLESLDYRQGVVTLPGGIVTLALPPDYYYLGPEDASAVLQRLWTNPFGSELGMITPATHTPWDYGAWAADLYFEDIGFVSDDDAATIDYDELLEELKADVERGSVERVSQGFESMTLVGWAAPPHYDPSRRQLHWAQELNFGGSDHNTLNYELRSLGRSGVLGTVFIADMEQLDQIRAALPEVMAMVSFTPGNRYADFDPSVDKVAALGIGGLILGKAASKAGLLAMALVFLKKFWFLLLIPLFWLKRLVFRRRT